MGLEAVTYIDDLNVDWPLATDKRRQGDDHLRNIKLAIKNTFPNITGPVTLTQAELNGLVASVAALVAENTAEIGTIKGWDLTNKPTLPTGWVLCDGQTVPGYGVVPDMRDRFIVAAGSTYNDRDTGGSNTQTSSASGAVAAGTTGSTTLTANQLPVITPRLYVWESGTNGPGQMEHFASGGIGPAQGVAGNADANTYGYRQATVGGNNLIESFGGGQGHTHTTPAISDHQHTTDVRPAYFALVFIVKVA